MSRDWLTCRNVGVALGRSVMVDALDNVTLSIDRGEYVAITGPSGSGKSTLLGILGCLRTPTRGHVTVCGVPDPDQRWRVELRRSQIGFVFQEFNLLPHLTAVDNVVAGLAYTDVGHRRRVAAALEMLELVGLGDRVRHRPPELSGGEQQRVALARALVKEPQLILADEPTGNLDSATSDDVLDLIDRTRKRNSTIVHVTHDDSLSARSDRRLFLRDGHLIEVTK